jgi:hypothetical protein
MFGKSSQRERTIIERFIIFHLGLLPHGCHNGFDESASTEELCEHILYYYDEHHNTPLDPRCRYNFDDAIKFAGLVSAFYSIQNTIDAEMMQEGQNLNPEIVDSSSSTTEVYLTSSSTLVFIPLENIKELIAVAQLSYPNSKKDSYPFRFTPSDVRHKVLKAHDIFKMTNGGGIHLRLSAVMNQQSGMGDSMMDELYNTYKYMRHLRMQQLKSSSSDTDEWKSKLQICQQKYDDTVKNFPLDGVRLDLKQFYDSFLRDLGSNEC